jgi:ATP-binding cassette, subfamily F, member 3
MGACGFGANLADSKCSTLSGGEKARLLFMLATFHGPHVLILDEPTNHLDVDSREALIMAINDYEGAVILIAHDRHIIETCADTLWLVAHGTVKVFDGDMDDYTRFVLGRAPAKPAPVVQAKAPPKPPSAALKKKIQEADLKIIKLKEKMGILDQALADPSLYREEPKKAADFAKLRDRFEAELEHAETRWLELHEGSVNA